MSAEVIYGVDFRAKIFQREAERAVSEALFGDKPEPDTAPSEMPPQDCA